MLVVLQLHGGCFVMPDPPTSMLLRDFTVRLGDSHQVVEHQRGNIIKDDEHDEYTVVPPSPTVVASK